MNEQLSLFKPEKSENFTSGLKEFCEFGAQTQIETVNGVPYFINEFWTARQRQAHRLHEVSYRACFKPQLPAFFIDRLTDVGDVVFDPFMGRGTTPLEAALRGRIPYGNDTNPLSRAFVEARINPPTLAQIDQRIKEIPWGQFEDVDCETANWLGNPPIFNGVRL